MKIFCTLVCFLAPAATAAAAVQPAALRCEYRVNPLGIDVARPRLSWIIESAERGQRQTAYRVLVATSAERLAADEGDLWDSGRVASDQTIHVVYAGRPLGSRMACFWKVRAWDARGQASPWSRAASWSMGLLDRADWQAQWIADSKTAGSRQIPPHNGYHSAMANSPDAAKWVSIDLGKPQPMDAVRLYPARPFDWSPDTPGFLFPVRLKIEAGQAADGSDLKVVVDRTAADIPNPGAKPVEYRFPAVTARLVRLTATRLARRDKDNFGLALAEMEVLSGEKNLALGATVHCLDSIESGAWSKAKLVDGRTSARARPGGDVARHDAPQGVPDRRSRSPGDRLCHGAGPVRASAERPPRGRADPVAGMDPLQQADPVPDLRRHVARSAGGQRDRGHFGRRLVRRPHDAQAAHQQPRLPAPVAAGDRTG